MGPPSLEENEVKIDEEEEEGVKLEEEKVRETEARGERETPEGCNWEDMILEDTVPLVGFVRMILHSGKLVSLLMFFWY